MKRVLVITYYWPPSGGSGVQRWLKFVKYLPEFGWSPVVYTPENPEFPVVDNTLFEDVSKDLDILKTKIFEPYNFYKSFINQKKEEGIKPGFVSDSEKPKLKEKISIWIRGNLFIPDARMFWIRPSVRYLDKYLKKNEIDLIITTGPPHSLHLIGCKLKQKHNIHWIADFRDPWTNIDFYKDLLLTKWADSKHKRLEKKVLEQADLTVVIGNSMKTEFENLGGERVRVITNGYDDEDILKEDVELDTKFTITHVGILTKTRNAKIFWEAISDICKRNQLFADNVNIRLIGKIDYSVKESIKRFKLESKVDMIDYLPHKQVVRELLSSHVLLLLINNTPNAKGIVTGKFFEYLATKRPILAIGPEDGDVSEIIHDTKSGFICDFENVNKLIEDIETLFNRSRNIEPDTTKIGEYSRRMLCSKYTELMDEVIKGS